MTATKKAAFQVKCCKEALWIGSKGAPISLARTMLSSQGGDGGSHCGIDLLKPFQEVLNYWHLEEGHLCRGFSGSRDGCQVNVNGRELLDESDQM